MESEQHFGVHSALLDGISAGPTPGHSEVMQRDSGVRSDAEGLRSIMSEWMARFPGGTDGSTSLRHWQSIQSVVRCALRSISSDLSNDDRQSIRTRVRSTLSAFRGFLRTSPGRIRHCTSSLG